MGVHKNKAYSLRLDDELMEKIRVISTKEDRPLSKQLERIIKEWLEKYEQQNGNIIIQNNSHFGDININQ